MKKLLLLLSIVIVLLSSCGDSYTTHLYRVKFITSGAKTIVKDKELGTTAYGSYNKGDTVHVSKDSITTDGRFRKAIVIGIIN